MTGRESTEAVNSRPAKYLAHPRNDGPLCKSPHGAQDRPLPALELVKELDVEGEYKVCLIDDALLRASVELEVVARLCNEKVPEPRAEPFEETLNSWLALFFLPAIRTVCKARQIRI